MTAKVISLCIERQLREVEAGLASETIRCGPPVDPVRFVGAYLDDDFEHVVLESEDVKIELSEGAAALLGHRLLELVRIRRASRGLAT